MYTRTDFVTEAGEFYVLENGRHFWLHRKSGNAGLFIGVYGSMDQARKVAEAIVTYERAGVRIAAGRPSA